MDLHKVQKSMTRERVQAFLTSVEMDPAEVAAVRIYPNRVVVERFLFTPDGKMQLDHLGPRTTESHFNITDD